MAESLTRVHLRLAVVVQATAYQVRGLWEVEAGEAVQQRFSMDHPILISTHMVVSAAVE
jgi:hypothetical protein